MLFVGAYETVLKLETAVCDRKAVALLGAAITTNICMLNDVQITQIYFVGVILSKPAVPGGE